MSAADDADEIRRTLDRARGSGGVDILRAMLALARLLGSRETYLAACARVTDLANAKFGEEDSPRDVLLARELRRALGDGYLGGPIA